MTQTLSGIFPRMQSRVPEAMSGARKQAMGSALCGCWPQEAKQQQQEQIHVCVGEGLKYLAICEVVI